MHKLQEAYEGIGLKVYSAQSGSESISLSIDVWAKPGSKKEKISIGQEGELVVSVSARPVEGAANKAISKFASKRLGISASSFSLDSGDKSKHKRFKVTYVFTDHKDVDYYLAKLKQLIK